MRRLVMLCFALSLNAPAFAQSLPPPAVVANTVSNLWHTRNMAELSVYATNLYSGATNYVPAILTSVFHDCIFRGDIQPAISNLMRIQNHVVQTPQSFTENFKRSLAEAIETSIDELNMHAGWGHTPQMLRENASPQALRDIWDGGEPLPYIFILFEAPPITLP